VERQTGVYCWSLVTGKLYVGGAFEDFDKRRRLHETQLRCRRHPNRHLTFAWHKYGENAFQFLILERCPKEEVEKKEQEWLDWLWTLGPGARYNLCPTSESVKGLKLNEEQREKRRQAGKIGGRGGREAKRSSQEEVGSQPGTS